MITDGGDLRTRIRTRDIELSDFSGAGLAPRRGLVEIYNREEIEAILRSELRMNLYSSSLLSFLDPHVKYDRLLDEQNLRETIRNGVHTLVVSQQSVVSPLFKTDPWLWKSILKIKKFLETGKIYEVYISLPTLNRNIKYTEIKRLGESLDRFVTVKGIIRKVSTVVTAIIYTQYRCKKCGKVTAISHFWYDKLKSTCCESCGAKGIAEDPSSRETESWQTLEIYPTQTNEYFHSLKLRVLDPASFDCYSPGQQILCNGILKGAYKDNATTEVYLDVENLEPLDRRKKKITPRDMTSQKRYLESLGVDYWEGLKRKCFPTIKGANLAKDAALLQLFGGLKGSPRENSHILLVGNPSTGKSALMRALQRITGGSFVSGMGSTNAGLTATAYKDASGCWTLDGGALVMSQPKTIFFDELDKVGKSGQDALLQAMEQQTVSVAKAGINLVLPAKCRILGACNPVLGCKFDQNKPYVEQLGLSPPLLSRFDLIVTMTEAELEGEDFLETVLVKSEDKDQVEAIKSYMEYCQTLNPIISEPLKKKISSYYLETKEFYKDCTQFPFNFRQLEGFVRLSAAKAKSRLSGEIQEEDWEFVRKLCTIGYQKLMKVKLKNNLLPPGIHDSKLNSSEQRITERILEILSDKGPASSDSLFRTISLEDKRMTRNSFEKCLGALDYIGKIYKPDRRNYCIINPKVKSDK